MSKSTTTTPKPMPFEPEFIAGLKSIFEEKIVFNQVLGLKVTHLSPDSVVGRIDMKPELVGHYAYNRIHGGVISAGLDAMGGLAVMAAIGARHMDEAPSSACTALPSWAPSTCASTTCAPASARISSCARRCCGWARAWPARAWSFWAPTAPSCRPARALTSSPDGSGAGRANVCTRASVCGAASFASGCNQGTVWLPFLRNHGIFSDA